MKAPLPVYLIHWNAADRAIRSVSSLLTTERVELAITVIDNASRPEEYEKLERGLGGRVRLIRLTSNIGFAGAANYALAATGGWPDVPEFLVIAAHDVTVEPDTLSKLVRAAACTHRAGALGPSLWEPGFRRRRSAASVETGREDRSRDLARSPAEGVVEADWVPGALCLFRTRCLLQLGGFDERLFSYCEDVDICLRARRAGWIVGCVPDARAVEAGHTVDEFSRVYLISRNHLLVTLWRLGRWVFLREAVRLGGFSARAWIGSVLPTRSKQRRARSRLFARAQWAALRDAVGKRDGSPLWLDRPERART